MKNTLPILLSTLIAFSCSTSTQAVEKYHVASDTQMSKEYVQMIGRMAYFWGYPIVNSYNRKAAFIKITAQHGNIAGLNGGVLPVAPIGYNAMLTDYIKPEQTFIACPNQDVVYGAGYYDLDKGPIVFQVPEFEDRFWIYALYDERTNQFGSIGKPYGTKPGFYLLVGANWKGEIPPGITEVIRAPTHFAFSAPRVFKSDDPADTKAVNKVISQILFYPLSDFDGKMKIKDWSKLPSFPLPPAAPGEVKWVVPEKYFEDIDYVIKNVPPLPGEEAIYRWIESVLNVAKNNAEMKKTLIESFVAADKELITPLIQWKYNGSPVGNGWNSMNDNAQWGTDYLNRTATSKSNIYENIPAETKYFYRDFDSNQEAFHGKNTYSITFTKAQIPPVKGFWSLTLYNKYHLFTPNALNRYSLGTKNKSLKYNSDGSLTLYFSEKSPGKDKESNWIPAPNDAFSLYIRAYWSEKSVLDGTWTPPEVEKYR